ncbi:hypothetical protein BGZ88_012449 [Linnemannia elongata]|nr:hypothetical protein BGZ88_012449 [Linnemannia elongata]
MSQVTPYAQGQTGAPSSPFSSSFPVTLVTLVFFMTRISRTHPLDLHEIRSRIANSLGLKALASCARVSQDWNGSFTPPLYKSVVLSKRGLSMESLERNKHLIRHLKIRSTAYEIISLTSERDKVVTNDIVFSVLTTLDLEGYSFGPNEVEAPKTNSTLTALTLYETWIMDDGAQELSEALKTYSTLTTLRLHDNLVESDGAVALAEALKTNSTLITLILHLSSIELNGAVALAEALKANSTLTILDLDNNSIGDNGAVALSDAIKTGSTLTIMGVPIQSLSEP